MTSKKRTFTVFAKKLGVLAQNAPHPKAIETNTVSMQAMADEAEERRCEERFNNAMRRQAQASLTAESQSVPAPEVPRRSRAPAKHHEKRNTRPHFKGCELLVAPMAERHANYELFKQLYLEKYGTLDRLAHASEQEACSVDAAAEAAELISKTALAMQRQQFPGVGTLHSVHYGMEDDIVRQLNGERGIYERTKVRGLVKYLHGREEPWPMSSDFVCWTDGHKFSGVPFGVPMKHDETTNRFYLTGNFCSPNCTKHYIENDVHTSPALRERRLQMLQKLCCDYFGYAFIDTFFSTIEPMRLYTHQRNGMSIEEYRANHKQVTIKRMPANLLLITDEVQVISIERRRTENYNYCQALKETKKDEYVSKDHARTQKMLYGQSRITPSNTIPHSQQQTMNRRFHGVIDKRTAPAPTLDAHRKAVHVTKKGARSIHQFLERT